MAIAPAPVEWRPLPENRTQPASDITLEIIHSIVGSAEGAYGFFLNSTSLESHFIIKKNGYIIQCINTDRSADANFRANKIAISVETEDNGNPNTDPWTPAQIESILWLLEWSLKAHPNIERKKAVKPFGTGLGYHTLFGAPSDWTPVSKTCPGTVRIKQFNDIILPRFLKGPATTKPQPTTPAREDTEMIMYHDATRKKIYLDRNGNITDITAYDKEFWQLAGAGRVPVIPASQAFITALDKDIDKVAVVP